MGMNRIVRKALSKTGECQKAYHRKDRVIVMRDGEKHMQPKTAWIDRRPRDKEGNLKKVGV